MSTFQGDVKQLSDALGTRINPATEDTLVLLATEATLAAMQVLLGGGLPAALGANGGLTIEGILGGVEVPVSVAALPLPAGAATEATLATRASEATLVTLATQATLAAIQALLPVALQAGGGLEIGQTTHDELQGNANLQVGNVDVGGANPVPMSAAALPLPAGAATEATLATRATEATLATLATQATLAAIQALLPVALQAGGGLEIGQTTHDELQGNANLQVGNVDVGGANPVPISAAALPLPAGAATQATLATLATQVTAAAIQVLLAGGLPAALAAGGGLQVEGVAGGVAQPISAAALPLPAGAATEATLATLATQATLAAIQALLPVALQAGGGLEIGQTTHDELQGNANLQVGNVDVGGANPVPISAAALPLPAGAATEATLATLATQATLAAIQALLPVALQAGGGLEVGQTTHDELQANANLQVANTDVSTANPVPIQPFAAILEGGLTELIDQNDTEVSQNDYSKSVSVALGGTYSGEIMSVSLYATELGTGAVRANACYLYVFDADPTVLAGDTALALADWQSLLPNGRVLVDEWSSDANGGMGSKAVSIPFHAVSTLYFCVQNLGTAFNDAAGDDEELHLNLEWRRES